MAYKEIPGPVEGYKIFNEDMTCRGHKFEIGVINELGNDNPLELCKNGFHFCKYPSGVWAYYESGRVFKIKAYGVLDSSAEPGADYKLVARSIEIIEEIKITGHLNTGYGNTGDRNTGNWNTGDSNTGNWNTGDSNTGDWNTGDSNTGDWNTGDSNTGNRNTGDGNAGYGNAGSRHSGWFGLGEAPLMFFGKTVKRGVIVDYVLARRLADKLMSDEPFDPTPFLSLPNASKAYIKRLHKAHIEGRKARR